MNNFALDIIRATDGEDVEAVVIRAKIEDYPYRDIPDTRDEAVIPYLGKILTWVEAIPLLNYGYDSGLGARDCHLVSVYTATRVFFVRNYDGATSLQWEYRNPTAATNN